VEIAALCNPKFAPANKVLEFAVVPSTKVYYHFEPVELRLVVTTKALLDLLVVAFPADFVIVVWLLGLFENDVRVSQFKAASGLAKGP
jgi:hypothetical protein